MSTEETVETICRWLDDFQYRTTNNCQRLDATTADPLRHADSSN
jgi:hypothetical protein